MNSLYTCTFRLVMAMFALVVHTLQMYLTPGDDPEHSGQSAQAPAQNSSHRELDHHRNVSNRSLVIHGSGGSVQGAGTVCAPGIELCSWQHTTFLAVRDTELVCHLMVASCGEIAPRSERPDLTLMPCLGYETIRASNADSVATQQEPRCC